MESTLTDGLLITFPVERTEEAAAESSIADEKDVRTREACYQPLKELVYENYRMLAPDGKLLCRCGKKKVDWYVSRGLARVLPEDPTAIQLNFVPGGHGEDGDAYQLADKNNHCVVCGRDDYNTKHHIVEYEYRQHMPVRSSPLVLPLSIASPCTSSLSPPLTAAYHVFQPLFSEST